MIDTLYQNLDRLQQPEFWSTYRLRDKSYFLLTLHRPANVDDPANLEKLLRVIMNGTGENSVVFPVHPRTKKC
jgi:UDP-N-acetylglucosamine 2-epimerase (non-hydrolysing)